MNVFGISISTCPTDLRRKHLPNNICIESKYAVLTPDEVEELAATLLDVAQQERVRKLAGYVYLLEDRTRAEDQGRYKMGSSVNPEARAKQILDWRRNGALLHTIESKDCRSDERTMQSYYSHLNTTKEWFALSQSDVDTICSIANIPTARFK